MHWNPLMLLILLTGSLDLCFALFFFEEPMQRSTSNRDIQDKMGIIALAEVEEEIRFHSMSY